MKILIGESFEPLLYDRKRYLILCGGAGSGKSEFAGRKIFFRTQTEPPHRYLVMRKVRKTLADSVVLVMQRILQENGLPSEYKKSERKIIFGSPAGPVELLFDGMDDPEKIKSIKGITGIWLEEATEFSRDEFLQIDLRLREPGPKYLQLILSFNPDEAVAPWLKEMFFDRMNPDATVHRSTIEDNPIKEIRLEYKKRLDALKETDEAFYKIYRLGLWAAQRGQIYEWPVVPHPPKRYDEIWYGGDFGYSVDPAAIVRIYRRADEYYLEEILYQTGLTNQQLAVVMEERGVDCESFVYFDSAEPKSIEEIRSVGFNVHPSEKGPDSVRSGIDKLKSKKIFIIAGSQNIINETNRYHWRVDKSGRPLAEPVKYEDHLMDAIRYGIITHEKHSGISMGVLSHDIRPD